MEREDAAFSNLMLEATCHLFCCVLPVKHPIYGRGQQSARSGDRGRLVTTGWMFPFYSGRICEAPARSQAALWSLGFQQETEQTRSLPQGGLHLSREADKI